MDAKFLSLTALLAAAAFGVVWVATTPAPAAREGPISPMTETLVQGSAKSPARIVIEEPPEDVEPVPAYAESASRPIRAAASVYYPNCGAARAAGVAPIYIGEPGYRPEMDGDADGIACEPHRR